MQLFKRWRRSRSDQQVESVSSPSTIMTPTVAPQLVNPGISTGRARRPATMGRTEAEQAYLAQAAVRAKQG